MTKIWAINENLETIQTFEDSDHVSEWLLSGQTYFQILYRINDGPIHVLYN